MKKLLALLLALILAAGILPALAEAQEQEESVSLPAGGDVVEGFKVTEIRPYGIIGADLVLFEHERTGAKLLYIANEDNNRVFQLTFLTRMENDKGIPHVFEHGTLSGSAKYPSTSLWMNVAYQTYNTYMNAYTTDAMTCYPVASLSEAQLLKLADMYTDMCLNPDIMKKESIYRTEAWRYEMADAEAPLTYNGTVYSEMLGARTLARVANINANKVTFPGASVSYEYGGDPDVIPELTWQELKDYHDKYYHPSNCLAILYGEFEDYTLFLKMLNEAFAPFEKKEFSFEEPGYTRITEPAVSTFSYPVAEGTDTAAQTAIFYYILCPDMKGDTEQENLIDHACYLLGSAGSEMMKALQKAFPTGSFSVGRELAAPDDAIVFVATGMNEGDAERFRETVDTALAEAAENGFTEDLVDNLVTSMKFNAKLASESTDPVGGTIQKIAYDYAVTGNIFREPEEYEALYSIGDENAEGKLSGAISRWLLNPELYTLTSTSPAPGEKEKHDAALAETLAGIKAEMSEEEISAIVEATNAAPAEEDNTELIAQLTAVDVHTLPEEYRTYELTDTTGEDGVRRIEAEAGVDGISFVMLNLDAAALPQEDIHYMRLFTRLLGNMDTDRHTRDELMRLIPRYLYDSTFGVFVSGWKNEYHPYMVAEWYSLDEDLESGYALAEEILYHTQFTDTQMLTERIAAQKNSVRSQINSAPYNVLLYRQIAQSRPESSDLYFSYLNYLDYYAFLEKTEQLMAEHPEEVTAGLERVQKFFANRSGAIAATAGNERSLAMHRNLTDAFFAKLEDTPREPAEYAFPVPSAREGLIVDNNVQFNMISAPWDAIDPEADGLSYSALGSLVTDQLMLPVLRDQKGAYGAYCASTNEDLYLYTYRDPNVAESFSFMDTLPDLVSAMDCSQEMINGYILSTYSSLAQSDGELAGAISALNNRISGVPENMVLKAMKALKATTPETMKAFAGEIALLLNTGIRGTAGSAAAVNANADIYETVLNPFNAKDLSSAEMDDLAEDNAHYQAITACMEAGMMAPVSETHFGTEDGATAGDFLGGFYLLVGGPSRDPEACRQLLADNGLMDASLDLATPLTEGFCCDLLTAVGATITTDTPEKEMTRGDLADLFSMFLGE